MSSLQWYAQLGQWEQFLQEEQMGYKTHEMKESKFIKKEDVTSPVLATIREVTRENVAKEGAEAEMKFVCHFEELDKGMVLNQTNIQLIQMACNGADDTDDWVGHKIVLYNDPNISFAGKITGGIRVRAPKQAVQKAIAESKKILAGHAAKTIEELEDDIPFLFNMNTVCDTMGAPKALWRARYGKEKLLLLRANKIDC